MNRIQQIGFVFGKGIARTNKNSTIFYSKGEIRYPNYKYGINDYLIEEVKETKNIGSIGVIKIEENKSVTLINQFMLKKIKKNKDGVKYYEFEKKINDGEMVNYITTPWNSIYLYKSGYNLDRLSIFTKPNIITELMM